MAQGRTDKSSATRAFYSKSRMNPALLGTYAFAGVTMIAVATILSPMMGVFVLGFLGLTTVIATDMHRRKFWEQSLSFRVQRQEEQYDTLSAEIGRQRQDIGRLKNHLTETNERLDGPARGRSPGSGD